MQLMKFESFNMDYNGLEIGDRVVVRYKDSKYFMHIGKIFYITKDGTRKGDCRVEMDSGQWIDFYYTNLQKIIEVICIPSGEVLYMPIDSAEELALHDIIKYNKKGGYYHCDDEDKWEIESWAI